MKALDRFSDTHLRAVKNSLVFPPACNIDRSDVCRLRSETLAMPSRYHISGALIKEW